MCVQPLLGQIWYLTDIAPAPAGDDAGNVAPVVGQMPEGPPGREGDVADQTKVHQLGHDGARRLYLPVDHCPTERYAMPGLECADLHESDGPFALA